MLSLIPRQHPTAGALHQLLGPEDLLRAQMADLSRSRSERRPGGEQTRPSRSWRPGTASTNDTLSLTNDTLSLVNATWGDAAHYDDDSLQHEAAKVPQVREGESAVLADFSLFLQDGGARGGGSMARGGGSMARGGGSMGPRVSLDRGSDVMTSPSALSAKGHHWKSSLGIMSALEFRNHECAGVGRLVDGGPHTAAGNRSVKGCVKSSLRPHTAIGNSQRKATTVVHMSGYNAVSPHHLSPPRPTTSGGKSDSWGAEWEETERSDGEGHVEPVFWGGRSTNPASVVPVVMRDTGAAAKHFHAPRVHSARRSQRAGNWRWGGSVNIGVHSWNCYDASVPARFVPTPAPDGGQSAAATAWGGGGQAEVLGSVPLERPVTAPHFVASGISQVPQSTFAPTCAPSFAPHQDINKTKGQGLSHVFRLVAPSGSEQGPRKTAAPRAATARSGATAGARVQDMRGGHWHAPSNAKHLFGRMQTRDVSHDVGNLDFASLSFPVIREPAPHTAGNTPLNATSRQEKLDNLLASLSPALTPGTPALHPLAASSTVRHATERPTTSSARRATTIAASKMQQRPQTAVGGRSGATRELDFLAQARVIVKEKKKVQDKVREKEQQREVQPFVSARHPAARPCGALRHSHMANANECGPHRPSPPATAKPHTPRSSPTRPMTASLMQTTKTTYGSPKGHDDCMRINNSTKDSMRINNSTKDCMHYSIIKDSIRYSRKELAKDCMQERAFPSPPRLSVSEALSSGNGSAAVAARRAGAAAAHASARRGHASTSGACKPANGHGPGHQAPSLQVHIFKSVLLGATRSF